jgi:hypothetical protein
VIATVRDGWKFRVVEFGAKPTLCMIVPVSVGGFDAALPAVVERNCTPGVRAVRSGL